ncbi:zinc ribbon domain-containing protein [Halobium salinum]|uniref:Zinc ribbon domain-containing protein n=1 Tax=Halobium salinum TaxID=1364940 RepID=A0ABD5PGJ7_9EURY|nr:zinc ribbon domain-containing protein [Halobium salinum]
MTDTSRRAFVAAMIGAIGAVVGVAGLGHLFLREWRRAVAWFALSAGASLVLLTMAFDPARLMEPGFLLDVQQWPRWVVVTLFVLLSLSIFDAYVLGRRSHAGTEGPTCPACARPVDPEMGFCHWCTLEFEDPRPDEPHH